MKKARVANAKFVLSAYGPVEYGCGHITTGTLDGLKATGQFYRLSTSNGANDFESLLREFSDLPLGTEIRVTATATVKP